MQAITWVGHILQLEHTRRSLRVQQAKQEAVAEGLAHRIMVAPVQEPNLAPWEMKHIQARREEAELEAQFCAERQLQCEREIQAIRACIQELQNAHLPDHAAAPQNGR